MYLLITCFASLPQIVFRFCEIVHLPASPPASDRRGRDAAIAAALRHQRRVLLLHRHLRERWYCAAVHVGERSRLFISLLLTFELGACSPLIFFFISLPRLIEVYKIKINDMVIKIVKQSVKGILNNTYCGQMISYISTGILFRIKVCSPFVLVRFGRVYIHNFVKLGRLF